MVSACAIRVRERKGWVVLASNVGKFRLTPGRAVEFIRQLNFCLNHDGIRPSVAILSTPWMGPLFEPKARQRPDDSRQAPKTLPAAIPTSSAKRG